MISESYSISGIEPHDIDEYIEALDSLLLLEDDEELEKIEADTEDEGFKWGEEREDSDDEEDYIDMSGATTGER